MMRGSNENDIKKPNMILCEGRDAKYFLIYYLEHLLKSGQISDEFCVHDFGGNEQLSHFLKIFTMQGEFRENAHSVCIVRDGERDGQLACNSINNAFEACGFESSASPCQCMENSKKWRGVKTGFAIFPAIDAPENGALEDLCLEILSRENAPYLVERGRNLLKETADHYGRTTEEEFPRLHKNVLNLYFSLTNKYVSLKIGEAARAGAFNWRHRKLEPLRNFFRDLAS